MAAPKPLRSLCGTIGKRVCKTQNPVSAFNALRGSTGPHKVRVALWHKSAGGLVQSTPRPAKQPLRAC